MPLFFGAHGFGFPFTLGGFGASLIPDCCGPAAVPVPVPVPVPAPVPACLPAAPACAPAAVSAAPAAVSNLISLATSAYMPFITGQELLCPLGPGFGITPWAFGLGGCTRSMPLFFGAHGFGFPFTLGGFGASLIPDCGPAVVPVPVPVPAPVPACLPAAPAVTC
jgi:hypothetical protein